MGLFATAILYANAPDADKMRSYATVAMPQVWAEYKGKGLISWSITELKPGPDGKAPPYTVQALLVWQSQEAASAGWADSRMKEVTEALKGFANGDVAVVNGDVLGSS